MFNFIKKANSDKDDKERRKRDKKDGKTKQKRERTSMSAEELLRIDEVSTSSDFVYSLAMFLVKTTTNTNIGQVLGHTDVQSHCFDPMFVLTLDREYDENKTTIVFPYAYLFITSRTTTINCSQLSDTKCTVLF